MGGRRQPGRIDGPPNGLICDEGQRPPTAGALRLQPGLPADQEVAPRTEAVDDPIEVALALPVAFLLGQARPAAMLVLDRGQLDGDRPTGRAPLPFVAQDEAPPDVEVAVEAELLVEWPAIGDVGAAERQR